MYELPAEWQTTRTGLGQVLYWYALRGWGGRNITPFWQQNELFCDEDVTPTGVAGTYDAELGGGKLTAAAGAFYLPDGVEDYDAADVAPVPAADEDETLGYVFSVQWGRLSQRHDWLIGYSYAHIETFSVNASYAQADWVRFGSGPQTAGTDSEGHEAWGTPCPIGSACWRAHTGWKRSPHHEPGRKPIPPGSKLAAVSQGAALEGRVTRGRGCKVRSSKAARSDDDRFPGAWQREQWFFW